MKNIEAPLKNGYCSKCENSDNGCHCFMKKLYGHPIPTFAIERCSEYKEKK